VHRGLQTRGELLLNRCREARQRHENGATEMIFVFIYASFKPAPRSPRSFRSLPFGGVLLSYECRQGRGGPR
jgi:hypothetical protein